MEAKASKNEDGPKFLRRSTNTRKPGVAGTLKDNAVRDASELLEPLEDGTEVHGAGKKVGGGKSRGGAIRGPASPPKIARTSSEDRSTKVAKPVLVQMSHEWIRANIDKAVVNDISDSIRLKGTKIYSRHLFYSPAYHPSGSPAAHMKAKLENLPEAQHAEHQAFHYDDSEIGKAVNLRKASLRKEHGHMPSLKAE